jgi:hypothetical protein
MTRAPAGAVFLNASNARKFVKIPRLQQGKTYPGALFDAIGAAQRTLNGRMDCNTS